MTVVIVVVLLVLTVAIVGRALADRERRGSVDRERELIARELSERPLERQPNVLTAGEIAAEAREHRVAAEEHERQARLHAREAEHHADDAQDLEARFRRVLTGAASQRRRAQHRFDEIHPRR
jgi:hypothetical protein